MDPINRASTITANPAPAVEAFQPSKLDRDSFLKLLVAQLKFQNPAEPMDPSNLLGQTAQLTMVDKMNELVALQQSMTPLSNAAVAGSLIGKNVIWNGGEGTIDAVRLTDGNMEVIVQGVAVPFDQIIEVGAPKGSSGGSEAIAPQPDTNGGRPGGVDDSGGSDIQPDGTTGS